MTITLTKLKRPNYRSSRLKRYSTLIYVTLALLLSTNIEAFSFENNYTPDDIVVYKNTPQGDLELHIFYPDEEFEEVNRPSILFFFGGGWTGGDPKQFYQQSRYMNSLGLVAISAQYRIRNTHKTTPIECVEDGKSALRWMRKNATKLGIDPNKIVASGGSAGGHVAACTGVIEGYDNLSEDLTVSSRPNAMILFNPVIDTTDKGYGSEKLKGKETIISPCHHVRPGIVSTLIFHGTKDTTVPYENVERFERLMEESGNECTLVPSYGSAHGFFNGSLFRKGSSDTYFNIIMYESARFLRKLKFIDISPALPLDETTLVVPQ